MIDQRATTRRSASSRFVGCGGLILTVAAWSWIHNAWNYRSTFIRTAKKQEVAMALTLDDLGPLTEGAGNETGSHRRLFNLIFLALLVGFVLFTGDAFRWS